MTDELKNILDNKELKEKVKKTDNSKYEQIREETLDGSHKFVLNTISNISEIYIESINDEGIYIDSKLAYYITENVNQDLRISKSKIKDIKNYNFANENTSKILAISTYLSFLKFNYYLIDYEKVKEILNSLNFAVEDYIIRGVWNAEFNVKITKDNFEKLIEKVNAKTHEQIVLMDRYNDELWDILRNVKTKRKEFLQNKKEELERDVKSNTKEFVSIIYRQFSKKYLSENNIKLVSEYSFKDKDNDYYNVLSLLNENRDIIKNDKDVDMNLLKQILESDGFAVNIRKTDYFNDGKLTIIISREDFEEKIREVNREEKTLKRIFRRW